MNKTLVKNILIAVFVPTVISVGYFGAIYLLRKNKEKKILEEVTKKLSSAKTKLANGNEDLISNWKKTLSSMKTDDFNPFYDYFMVTIPIGKVPSLDEGENETWVYEKTNPIEFSAISQKGLNSIKDKEIEGLFEALKNV